MTLLDAGIATSHRSVSIGWAATIALLICVALWAFGRTRSTTAIGVLAVVLIVLLVLDAFAPVF